MERTKPIWFVTFALLSPVFLWSYGWMFSQIMLKDWWIIALVGASHLSLWACLAFLLDTPQAQAEPQQDDQFPPPAPGQQDGLQ